MLLAIDIGATKTLLAVFSADGEIVSRYKFATDKTYSGFLKDLNKAITEQLHNFKLSACCCALPGKIDRKNGVGISFGNLSWRNVPIKKDLERLLGFTQVWLEHDSSLAGLSEAELTHGRYRKIIYLTISTGIGDGIIIDDKIDTDLADSEAGQMVLEHDGKLQKWETFASGSALVKRYGKMASEIDDPKIWQTFANNLAPGIDQLVAAFQPDIIIIGGGVGAHFAKFGHFLKDRLDKFENRLVEMPPIIQAQRPEEAVVYGCYEYYKQQG
ncbi:MAG: ROK family protein [Candidatus Saccharimonadales bacterium]|jgi:glucokinase